MNLCVVHSSRRAEESIRSNGFIAIAGNEKVLAECFRMPRIFKDMICFAIHAIEAIFGGKLSNKVEKPEKVFFSLRSPRLFLLPINWLVQNDCERTKRNSVDVRKSLIFSVLLPFSNSQFTDAQMRMHSVNENGKPHTHTHVLKFASRARSEIKFFGMKKKLAKKCYQNFDSNFFQHNFPHFRQHIWK